MDKNNNGSILNNLDVLPICCNKFENHMYLGKYSKTRLSGILQGDMLDVFPSKPVIEQFRYPRFKSDQRFSGLISYFLEDYLNPETQLLKSRELYPECLIH